MSNNNDWIESTDDLLIDSVIKHEGNKDVIYNLISAGKLVAASGCDAEACMDQGTWPVYICSNGLDTVGIGHLITGNESFDSYAGISDNLANKQLELDLEKHLASAKNLARKQGMEIGGNYVVQRFMTELCFNIGAKGYSKFKNGLKKLTSAVNGDGQFTYNDAADEHLDSQWARQVKGRANEMVDTLRKLDV